jgi:hydroxymethylglutaryl-CoA reductase
VSPVSNSRLSGFYNLPLAERLAHVAEASGLDAEALRPLTDQGVLRGPQADQMIENVIGVYALPLGIATNFLINGKEYLIPMAIEEPSVVAGASFMARLARAGGGFQSTADEPHMIGQMQVLEVRDLERAALELRRATPEILAAAAEIDPVLRGLGGGPREVVVRTLAETPIGPMLVVHLIYDTRDAMGANAVNTACERLAPLVERITGGRVHLRILSNLADRRLARAECRIPASELGFESFSGERVRDGIIAAWAFAAADPYRAATHNKGIMNGVDAVVVATGNDWRAVEAGAHAYAARSGRYTALSRWWASPEGDLMGELEMPMAAGTVGGATRVHPGARASLALLGVQSALELAQVIVSVGLAQNLAALRALASEGIQRGHMGLHARQVAIAAGARGEQVEAVARRMVTEGAVRVDRAEAILKEGPAAESSTAQE